MSHRPTSVEQEDGLDEADRARLHAALDQAAAEFARGEGIPVAHVIAEARARHPRSRGRPNPRRPR